jgi:predicted O-methyltransferase YrrM
MADADSRTGHRYATPEILAFVERLHAAHDEALRLAFEAPERHAMPAIQVGASEGKLLELLVALAGARRVVEVGTLAGYSTLRLARALPPEPSSRVYTIELDPRHADVARASVAAAGLEDRVDVRVGRGADVLPELEPHGPFDVVFLDADKESYDVYGRWAAAHLRPGGLLLADNVYLFGDLLADTPRAAAMRRFHEEATVAFDTVVIPTPDGLLLGRRR